MEKLGEILGPRGIQHYVFLDVVRQIETISNSFLSILADSGIQLSLQGEAETEKIVKNVLVRSTDGELRERGLSQLSGGQWRRVSMALDLAYAEIVRRRGLLRSNLMVMDEVLTHLDASGREAVGSVLRAMVEGSRPANYNGESDQEVDVVVDDDAGSSSGGGGSDSDSSSSINANEARRQRHIDAGKGLLGGGSYETVLVILQDLAAMELEESFDHVDIVVKEADTSKVIVDGIMVNK